MKPTAETDVLAPLVALLYRNLRQGQIVSILITLLLTWVATDYVAPLPLAIWASLTVTIASIRLLLDLRYRNTAAAERDAQAALWRGRAIAGAFAGGLALACGTILLMSSGDLLFKMFTALVMAGMVAGAVQVVAADLTAFRCYAWPIALAVIVGSFSPDRIGISFAALAVIYMVGVSRGARFFNETLHDSIRLEREQAKLASHLAQANELAEQSLKAKTQFLSNISHELRTPMNGIMGIADLLLLDAAPEQKELLGHLRQSSDLLMTQIDNLINLSELEADEVRLNPTLLFCSELLATVMERSRKEATTKGIAIVVDSDPGIPKTLIGDNDCLSDALRHLVDNAVKFTDSGKVTVSARLAQRNGSKLWIEFAVSDTGPGISQEALKAIGGLLTQADGSSVRRHGGLGVGLAIVRRLVKLMGGELQIASEPGHGSVFSFTLPFPLPMQSGAPDLQDS